MAGLLSPGLVNAGLLGMTGFADKGDELFLRNQIKPRTYEGLPVTAPKASLSAPAGALSPLGAIAAPAPPERRGVSPLRVALSTLFSGTNPFEAADAERIRLDQEALRPQQLADRARIQEAIRQLPIEAQIAYALNPEKFGENFSEQFGVTTTSAGGRSDVLGLGRSVGAPSTQVVNDSIYKSDPITGSTTLSATADPGFDDLTQRAKQENDARIQSGQLAVNQGRLNLDESNAGFTVSPGQQRRNPDGSLIAENTNLSPQAEAQAQATRDKAANARTTNLRNVTNTLNAVDTALSQVGNWTAGPLSALAGVPGTPQANLKATLETIEANLAFGALAEMRANSPTGGALGGIAVRELDLLGATLANLRQSQSPDQLRRNLNTVKQSLSTLQDIYNDQQAGNEAQPSSGPQVGTVEDGYRFTGGDPASPSSWVRVN